MLETLPELVEPDATADMIEALLADKDYDADAIREELVKVSIEAVIAARRSRKNPAPKDAEKYKWRNLIERLFNKLTNSRLVAIRYDKTSESYLGFLAIAAVKLWLPFVQEAWTANNTHTLCIGSNGRAIRTPVAPREGNPLTFA